MKLSKQHILSFQDSSFSLIRLSKGTPLWRFISSKSQDKNGAYWIDVNTMSQIMNHFHANSNFSEDYKRRHIQDSLSLLSIWNGNYGSEQPSLYNWRVKIELLEDVEGATGKIASQLGFKNEIINSVFYNGTAQKLMEEFGRSVKYNQIIIPEFQNLKAFNTKAKIIHFSRV
jgi:hypothetical protein